MWNTQAAYHDILRDPELRARIADGRFAQRPVFWRLNTLGKCRFMPDEPLCPKAAWLSQQRRMLEKLNNLALIGGNMRPLDAGERNAILDNLQYQASMTWPTVPNALKPLYKARDEAGLEKAIRFNLEDGGDAKLLGNATEAKLAGVFGAEWPAQPHRQAIRDAVPKTLVGRRLRSDRRPARGNPDDRNASDFEARPPELHR